MPEHKEQLTRKGVGLPPAVDTETSARLRIVPKTDFGRELLALRNKAIADGMKVRGAEEILSEIEESRRP
ncbi:MAG: hypothetical protein LBP33_07100 [Candidatus Adiutrix sp.]|nr:hypothetical protein [Candidatus Adiutrix sp.]